MMILRNIWVSKSLNIFQKTQFNPILQAALLLLNVIVMAEQFVHSLTLCPHIFFIPALTFRVMTNTCCEKRNALARNQNWAVHPLIKEGDKKIKRLWKGWKWWRRLNTAATQTRWGKKYWRVNWWLTSKRFASLFKEFVVNKFLPPPLQLASLWTMKKVFFLLFCPQWSPLFPQNEYPQ